MELEVKAQALSLLCSMIAGAGLGLCYELLRLFPGHRTKLRLILSDLLFSLLAFCAAFLLGLSVCKGRLGLWEGALMALGFFLFEFTKMPAKKD